MKNCAGLILAAVMMLMIGCSNLSDTRSASQVLEARSAEHWGLLMNGQWQQALSMTTPAYQERTPVGSYAGKYGGAWTWQRVDHKGVDCDDEEQPSRCSVRSEIMYLIRNPQADDYVGARLVDRTWVKLQGDWYLYEG